MYPSVNPRSHKLTQENLPLRQSLTASTWFSKEFKFHYSPWNLISIVGAAYPLALLKSHANYNVWHHVASEMELTGQITAHPNKTLERQSNPRKIKWNERISLHNGLVRDSIPIRPQPLNRELGLIVRWPWRAHARDTDRPILNPDRLGRWEGRTG